MPFRSLLAVQSNFSSLALLKTATISSGPLQFQMASLASASPNARRWRQSQTTAKNLENMRCVRSGQVRKDKDLENPHLGSLVHLGSNGTIFCIPPAILTASFAPSWYIRRPWRIEMAKFTT